MIQQELINQNSGARTSDWIEQVTGGVILSYDIGALVAARKEETESTMINCYIAMGAENVKDAEEFLRIEIKDWTE